MTLANHFSRDCIGVRLRARLGLKGLHDVVFQETVWRRRRGSGGTESGEITDQGLHIEARPTEAAFQLAGVISQEIDGVRKDKLFRADRFTPIEEAADILCSGADHDAQGEKIFGEASAEA